jgi:guanyl-specific ribonuclease Sa
MRKIIHYLLLMVMSMTIAACMQPGGTPQQPADTPQQTTQLLTQPDGNDNAAATNDAQPAIDNAATNDAQPANDSKIKVKEQGQYTDKERVALYIHTYGRLPDNYITKAEAQKLGWDNTKGNLRKVAPGKSIGGDRFGNYEGQLPKASKRKYFECDIDYKSGKRNAKRIVFSNDGLIFYTDDHYKTFQQLY